MSKPNINIPTEFAINGTKTDFSQTKITNGFDRLQPDVLSGDNLNKFIDDTYKGLNGVLELYKGAVLYDVNETYTDTSIVFYIDTNDNNKIKVYHSLQNSNTGNPLSDETYWEEVKLGGASGRNVGEIITSSLPLTDAGLHLLDGTRLSGDGIYGEFVQYIADLYTENPTANYFTTESAWQASVTQYGVCGKFVYDSTNNTVRLPKITGIIEGTTDLTALGDLITAGLPNITARTYTIVGSDGFTGSFYGDPFTNKYNADHNDSAYWYENSLNFDASRSSSIYGNSTTVQPQTIKVLYYIVIATSSKTDIQVDIDEIATDLNGKADVDLSNVPASKGILVESYNNGTSWYRLYSDGWCEQGFRESKASGGAFNFLKTFRDTNYLIQISSAEGGGQPQRTSFDVGDIYTDRLNIYTYQGATQVVSLYVAGYIR